MFVGNPTKSKNQKEIIRYSMKISECYIWLYWKMTRFERFETSQTKKILLTELESLISRTKSKWLEFRSY